MWVLCDVTLGSCASLPALLRKNARTSLRLAYRHRKNVRTDDPVERIDTKILEVEIELAQTEGLRPGLRVTGYIARP